MQRAGVVGMVVVAGLAVVAAVALKGADPGREPEPTEFGSVRVPLERTTAPPLTVPEEVVPKPLAVRPEEDEEGGAEGVGEVETTTLGEGAQVLAPPPRDLTQIRVTLVAGKGANVASVLEQIGEGHGFEIEFAPGARERLESSSLTLNFQDTGLADVLEFLGIIAHTRLEIRNGKVHASNF